MSLDPNVKNANVCRVLVAPLDWGLGHTTRCIPVIYELIRQGAEVWIAGEGRQVDLLKKEFPQLGYLPLVGYNIRYSRTRWGLFFSILRQVPAILKTIRKEHQWLKEMVDRHGFNAVISDNRFGLWHPEIISIFITHQLRIRSPFGKASEDLLQKRNYHYIRRFSECWVPDNSDETGLAGSLSHPAILPGVPVHYAGILSRLKRTGAAIKKGHLFISLSGPEPQRSLLEEIVIRDIGHYHGTAVIARGLPGEQNIIPSTNDIIFYNHLEAFEYNAEMEKAEWVICRSGYSTIMDLAVLQKKSILIPTPGQTEQQYLGRHLQEKKFAVCIDQHEFSLPEALDKAEQFEYHLPNIPDNNLNIVVGSLIEKIRTRFEE